MTDAPRHDRTAPFTLMTWNIRRRMLTARRVDWWSRRKPAVRRVLHELRPTILCAQEVLPAQAEWLRGSLGDDYRSVGTGRSRTGRGEACPVLFDATRLQLLDWRQSALSHTPDAPGSRMGGSAHPRILVVAHLRDRRTGIVFRVINTHLDHVSSAARRHGARMVRAAACAAASPVIIAGDMNMTPDDPAAAELIGADGIRDAWDAAADHEGRHLASFTGYRTPYAGGRIDWVLTRGRVDVHSIAVRAPGAAQTHASDHLPVVADVSVGAP